MGMAAETNVKKKIMRKRKVDELSEQSNETPKPKTKKEKKYLTEIEFKVLLKDPNTTFNALEKFLDQTRDVQKENYDIVAKFCSTSANCSEILTLLEPKNRKVQEVYLIFEVLECVLIRIADDLKKYQLFGNSVVRQVLTSHLGYVYKLLAMRNKSGHIKASIKLLTAMVMQGNDAAKEVQAQFDFRHVLIAPLFNRRDLKDPEDVRFCYLKFLLSFLFIGDNQTVRKMVESKGTLNGIFYGLIHDKIETLQLVLPSLLEQIIRNPAVSKTAKIHLFNETSLKHIKQLYLWKGPKGWKDENNHKKQKLDETMLDDEELSPDQEEVKDMAHQLLMEVCCSMKHGIHFWDKSVGTSGKNMNHVLTYFMKSLQKPFLHPAQSSLFSQILKVCPDQIHHYLPNIHSSVNPRPSAVWVKCIDFLCKIYEEQAPVSVAITSQPSVPMHKLVAMTMSTLFPPKDFWNTIKSALKKHEMVVHHHGSRLILIITRRVSATLKYCHDNQATLPDGFLESLRDSVIKTLPTLDNVYSCWTKCLKLHKSPDSKDPATQEVSPDVPKDLPAVHLSDHLLLLLQLLCCYQDALPHLFKEYDMDYYGLLEGVKMAEQLKSDKSQPSQSSISTLQLFMLKLLSETDARQFNWTNENIGDRSTLYLLLEMITTTCHCPKTNRVIKHLVHKLFVRTGYFDGAEEEIHIWLNAVSSCKDDRNTAVTFMDKSMDRLLRNPYHFVDSVHESVAMATRGTEKEVSMETSSMSDTKALIEAVIAMEQTDLSETQEDGMTSGQIPSDLNKYSRPPFSALVPAALETLQNLHTGTEASSVSEQSRMVEDVLLEILHTSSDPLPLCELLKAHPAFSLLPALATSTDRWLLNSTTVKQKCIVDEEDWRTFGQLLRNAFEKGNKSLLDRKFQCTADEMSKLIYPAEAVSLTKQILLYTKTAVEEAAKQSAKLVRFYSKILNNMVQSVVNSSPKLSAEPESLMEVDGAQEESAEPEPEPLKAVDPPSDFLAMQICEPTTSDILERLFTIILQDSLFVDNFLETQKQKMSSDVVMETSLAVASVVAKIPESSKDKMLKYIQPYVTSIEETLSLDSGAFESWILQATQGFISLLQTESLNSLVVKLFDFKEHSPSQTGDQLTTTDSVLIDALTALSSERMLSQHKLPLCTFKRLANTAINSGSTAQLEIFSRILLTAPTYAVALSRGMFEAVLASDDEKMTEVVKIVLSQNPCCRHWFEEWLVECGLLKKKNAKWKVVRHVLGYLTGNRVVNTDLLGVVNKAFWAPLCKWACDDVKPAANLNVDLCLTLLLTLLELKQDDQESLLSIYNNITEAPIDDVSDLEVVKKKITLVRYLFSKLPAEASPSVSTKDEISPSSVSTIDETSPSSASTIDEDAMSSSSSTTDEGSRSPSSASTEDEEAVSSSSRSISMEDEDVTSPSSVSTEDEDEDDDDRAQNMIRNGLQYTCRLLLNVLKQYRDSNVVGEMLKLMLAMCKKLTKSCWSENKDIWCQFIKTGLRYMYDLPGGNYFEVLCHLLPHLYYNDEAANVDVSGLELAPLDICGLVMSHSRFLEIILREDSTSAKGNLVDLLVTLVDLDTKCCATSHISVLFGAYRASLGNTDQKLLMLLKKYEKAGCDMISYKPYMWGAKALEYHTLKKNLGPSLCKAPTMDQVLEVLDKDQLQKSMLLFPVRRKTQCTFQSPEEDLRSSSDLYDPCFLLPFFSNMLAPENIVNCRRFVEDGCLSYVVSSLSCHDGPLRGAAYHTLARFLQHLEGATKFGEKHQILYMLGLIKNSVRKANAKLPCVITIFLAKSVQLFLKPDDHMYQVVNYFLLTKPAMDFNNVPEFNKFFNSSAMEFKMERSWILDLLREGLRETCDYHIYERRSVFKVMLTFYECALSDKHSQLKILEVVKQACGIRSVGSRLAKNCGLLQWLGGAIHTGVKDTAKVNILVQILHTLWFAVLGDRDKATKGSVHSPEGSSDQGQPCLPVLFTNQMLLLVLDLLNGVRIPPPLSVFHRLLECLMSVCAHRAKSEKLLGASHTHTIMSVHFSLSHMIRLLSLWGRAANDKALSKHLNVGLGLVDKHSEEKTMKSPAKRSAKNEYSEDLIDKTENGDEIENAAKLKDSCLEFIINLVPHCEIQTVISPTGRKCNVDDRTAVLFLIQWSIAETRQHFPNKLDLYEKSISWFYNLIRNMDGLQDTLLSGDIAGETVMTHLLGVYNSTQSQNEDGKSDVAMENRADHVLKNALTQIFLKLTDRINQLPDNTCSTLIAERLRTKPFQRALKLLHKLSVHSTVGSQWHELLLVFILEVWLGTESPIQFSAMIDKL